ncbi:MAG TPA: sugar phosphate isomerase/epimerase family protein [Tepidisphaeraceae bacterium]|nr:sugar phosphate isomerase/epimerase family protein [Tepidisphaeraceae bacterium]
MRFAFSTVSCPKWDFETIVARAKEYGYEGVEIRGFLNESILTASNPFLTDSRKLRDLFADNGIDICCLASSIAMTQNRKRDKTAAAELMQFIDTAHALACPLVKIFDTQVRPGQDRPSAGVALGNWILPLAEYAAERDVVIVIENALSFRAAKEMWTILDRLQHPSVACCWDVFNAAMVGESPYVSVPTLNSKIQYTQVKDAKLGQLGATYTKLGEGDVKVQTFLTRLRGIGYNGWVTFEWEKAWLPNIAEPEEVLPHAIVKLREWTREGEDIEGAEADSEPAAPTKGAVVA